MTAQLNRNELGKKTHKPKAEAYNRIVPSVTQWTQDQIVAIRAKIMTHAPHDGAVLFEMLIDIDDE